MRSETIVKMDSFTKERPRTNFRTGAIYTPATTLNREKYIAREFIIQNPKWRMNEGAIKIDINITVNMPKQTKKSIQKEMLDGLLLPTKKPDVDNVAKLVMDALQGVAFEDDCQVVELQARKKYGVEKELKIIIENI